MKLFKHNDGGFLADIQDGNSIAVGDCGIITLIDMVETPDTSSYEEYNNDTLQDMAFVEAVIPVMQEARYTASQKYWAKLLWAEFGARIPNLPPLS